MILARLFDRRLKAFSPKARPADMPGFDREFYLANNPDVAAKGTDPLKHYLEHGWREGREPSAGFTGQRYLALNPDVRADGLNPLVHYLKHGMAEGRPGAWAETASSNHIEAAPYPVEPPPTEVMQPPQAEPSHVKAMQPTQVEAPPAEMMQPAPSPHAAEHPREPTRLL